MAPRKAKSATQQPNNNLLSAIKFLSLISKDDGEPRDQHCTINEDGSAIIFNGMIALGANVDCKIVCKPHIKTLLAALSKCGQDIDINYLTTNRLSVKSGKFRVLVPCADVLPLAHANEKVADLTPEFHNALEKIISINDDDEQRVVTASILINGPSVISTDGKIIIEAWHGLAMPTNIAIPKQAIRVVLKSGKTINGFGYSENSFTFWFDDGSWVRTQLMAEPWPYEQTNRILNEEADLQPIHEGFFEAAAAMAPFTTRDALFLNAGVLNSHASPEEGASYDVAGLPGELAFGCKYLNVLKDKATSVAFITGSYSKLIFRGDNLRGVLMGIRR